jgi:molybdopterin molybdotransferase
MTNPSVSLPTLDPIEAKMLQLQSKLARVPFESIHLESAADRILGQDILAFRDSPAIDVSAMDGYAIRIDELDGTAFRIVATTTAGSPPVELDGRSAVRVFTGGPVPRSAQCVVRREDCNESETYVSICVPKESLSLGQNIRRQGENACKGDCVASTGSLLCPTRLSGALTFSSAPHIDVYRPIRVSIINTGDELIEFGMPIEAWQIRDSNGPFLQSMLERHRWIQTHRTKVVDQEALTANTIRDQLECSDVLILTGGVSMGDTDFVPDAIKSCGCDTVFHRIPIRPGRPMLGAVGPKGQLVLGLPGNPLSVAVTFRRYAWDLIRYVAGMSQPESVPTVQLETTDTKTLDLTWFRLAKLTVSGRLNLLSSQGSGDIASLIESDGFVQVPPHASSAGERAFYRW